MSDNQNDNEDDKVGYKRPPKHSHFKKGQSGNPKGRQKKSKNLDTLMLQELDRKILLKEGGTAKHVSKREAIALRIVNGALRGNQRQLEFLFRYMRELGVPDPFGMTTDDSAGLTKALEALNAKQRGASAEGGSDDES